MDIIAGDVHRWDYVTGKDEVKHVSGNHNLIPSPKNKVFNLTLLKAQICTIYFHTCTQIFGIHKALMHVLRYKLSRLSVYAIFMCKIQYMLIVRVHYAK